jgi:hypothetical protein
LNFDVNIGASESTVKDSNPTNESASKSKTEEGGNGTVTAAMGIDIAKEEELLRQRKLNPEASSENKEHALPALPEDFIVNLPTLRSRMEKIAGKNGLAHISESAVYYLCLALQDRLKMVLTDAIHMADLRTQVSLNRDLAAYGVEPLTTLNIPYAPEVNSPSVDGVLRKDPSAKRIQYELVVSDYPEALLSSIESRDIESQIRADERIDAMKSQSAQKAQDQASSSTQPSADPSGSLPSAPESSFLWNESNEGGMGTKKKKEKGPTIAEEPVRQRSANATAFFAAGGNAKSWMTMGSSTNGGGNATSGNANGSSSQAMSSVKRAYLMHKKRSAGLFGRMATSVGKLNLDGQGVPVPGTGLTARARRLQSRDILFALNDEILSGAGKCNATGLGRVMAKHWVKLREK